MTPSTCPYCAGPGGRVLWSDAKARVILAEDSPFAGLCRVIWNDHVKELTDLGESDRARLLALIAATELGIRELLQPAKINLASLGTAVPHLHWHVIPRFPDDTHYPEPIWAAPQRPAGQRKTPQDFPAVLGKLLAGRLGASSAAP